MLSGFNKSAVYGAHPVINTCGVSDPEKPTGTGPEVSSESFKALNKPKRKRKIENYQQTKYLNVDVWGWVVMTFTVGTLGLVFLVSIWYRKVAMSVDLWSKNDMVHQGKAKADRRGIDKGGFEGAWAKVQTLWVPDSNKLSV